MGQRITEITKRGLKVCWDDDSAGYWIEDDHGRKQHQLENGNLTNVGDAKIFDCFCSAAGAVDLYALNFEGKKEERSIHASSW